MTAESSFVFLPWPRYAIGVSWSGRVILIETSVFTRQVLSLLADEEYRRLQVLLSERPNAGALIKGSGGLRKVRWTVEGRGKRGGVRIIYFWAVAADQLLLLLIYPKNVRDDLSPAQLNALRRIIEKEYP
jgi:hypothetical protein